MQQPGIEQMNKFCSQGYAVMKDYGQINTRFWKKCTEQQLEFLQLCTEYGQRAVDLWTNGKDLPGLIGAQSSIAMEFAKKYADQSRAALTSLTEAGMEATRAYGFPKDQWTAAPKGKRSEAA
jgi:hypothetical protein